MTNDQNLTPVATGSKDLQKFENPGLPPHQYRQADVDPKAERRVNRQIVIIFLISIAASIFGIYAYFAFPPGESFAQMRLHNLTLGVGIGFGFLAIGIAAIHWAKTLMSDHEVIEEREPTESDAETREAAVAELQAGFKDSGLVDKGDGKGVPRRGMLKGALLGAVALAPLPIVVPLVGNLSKSWDTSVFKKTLWEPNMRLAYDPSGRPIKAADVTIGSAVHVIPENLRELGGKDWHSEKAKAVVLLVRLNPDDLIEAEDRKDWSYEGIVAYSKICTHVGCPVALYEQHTHHLLCPCHQSTFDMTDGAKVVFGPAKRPLPQLPISVDEEGYLVAQSDFHEPIGPSYWERVR